MIIIGALLGLAWLLLLLRVLANRNAGRRDKVTLALFLLATLVLFIGLPTLLLGKVLFFWQLYGTISNQLAQSLGWNIWLTRILAAVGVPVFLLGLEWTLSLRGSAARRRSGAVLMIACFVAYAGVMYWGTRGFRFSPEGEGTVLVAYTTRGWVEYPASSKFKVDPKTGTHLDTLTTEIQEFRDRESQGLEVWYYAQDPQSGYRFSRTPGMESDSGQLRRPVIGEELQGALRAYLAEETARLKEREHLDEVARTEEANRAEEQRVAEERSRQAREYQARVDRYLAQPPGGGGKTLGVFVYSASGGVEANEREAQTELIQNLNRLGVSASAALTPAAAASGWGERLLNGSLSNLHELHFFDRFADLLVVRVEAGDSRPAAGSRVCSTVLSWSRLTSKSGSRPGRLEERSAGADEVECNRRATSQALARLAAQVAKE